MASSGLRSRPVATDLYLSRLAQQMRTAHRLLASGPKPEAVKTILQPIADRLFYAKQRAERRGDHGRALAAGRRLAAVHRMYHRAIGDQQ